MIEKEKYDHRFFMERCLSLASKALGNTGSNPMVGAVIVNKGKILSEAYHRKFGEAHAEVHAIESVKNKKLLAASTLYVNLEPCSHYGKTPPCADLIIRHAIPNVIIGTKDPNPLIMGKGIEKMKNAGCNVMTGVMEEECRFLNRRFFTFHEKQRPYIILKWAESKDGFIDIVRDKNSDTGPNWITGPYERILVHKWRSEESAILAGTNTIEKDNPALTVRSWSGTSPERLIIDNKLRLKADLKIFQDDVNTIVFNNVKSSESGFPAYIRFRGKHSIWPEILAYLYEKKLISVLIEGGAFTINSLLDANLWDEARVFTGDKDFNNGVRAPGPVKGEYDSFKTCEAFLRITYNEEPGFSTSYGSS